MFLSKLLYKLYGLHNHRVRRFVLNLVKKLEMGEFYSSTLRRIFKDYHKVEIGMYTQGGCFMPGRMDPFTKIGRYCSIAQGVRVFGRDHPLEFKGTHGFFFNTNLGYCETDPIEYTPTSIGNDVWIAYGATVLSNVKSIGDGAVIGAGANVNKDVPPYGVVVGNPGRVVRYRFSKEIIEELLTSRWWEQPIEEIKLHIHEFQQPYEKLYLARKGKTE